MMKTKIEGVRGMDVKGEKFGNLIKRKRLSLNISLRELSRMTGVSHPYLSQLENGRNENPSSEVVLKICKHLKIDLENCQVDTTALIEGVNVLAEVLGYKLVKK